MGLAFSGSRQGSGECDREWGREGEEGEDMRERWRRVGRRERKVEDVKMCLDLPCVI